MVQVKWKSSALFLGKKYKNNVITIITTMYLLWPEDNCDAFVE